MKCLLLGAGTNREKRLIPPGSTGEWGDLTTVDLQDADIIHDLNIFPYYLHSPHHDELYDEIHAYEILEHLGTQGDFKFFFEQFNQLHHWLKPGGYLCLSVPKPESIWAFGDPGHTRILPYTVFKYLTKSFYDQLGKTSCTDYRSLIRNYWEIAGMSRTDDADTSLYVILRA